MRARGIGELTSMPHVMRHEEFAMRCGWTYGQSIHRTKVGNVQSAAAAAATCSPAELACGLSLRAILGKVKQEQGANGNYKLSHRIRSNAA